MENLKNKDLLIVVPYRNREEHLKDFLENTPKYFDKQNLTYDILICELDQKGDWNAGLCVNSLIKFTENTKTEYKYLYIHHVDIWPISGDWIFPKENEVYFNMGDYGSCLLTMKAFLDVKGYSNSFWGWGGEDNELYQKLREKNYKVNELSNFSNIQYETKHQTHERKFNGKNYANTIKQLMILPKEKRNNLSHFNDHAEVVGLKNIKNNIYKQTVIPKKESADKTKNNKVLLGYIKNIKSFEKLVAYVKSAGMHMPYEFDMVMIIADEEPDSHVTNQLEAFGVNWIKRNKKYNNLFIDRFDAYLDFLQNNKYYNYILHTDVTDVFFQNNPFEYLDSEKITLTDEGVSIKEENWNRNLALHIYDTSVLQSYWNNNVLCGGIIGGPTDKFIKLMNLILTEYNKHPKSIYGLGGVDQIILNNIVYCKSTNLDINIKNNSNDFAINLHVPTNYKNIIFPVEILSNKVLNTKTNNKYSIVHQYNRQNNLYKNITNYYNQYYYPIY